MAFVEMDFMSGENTSYYTEIVIGTDTWGANIDLPFEPSRISIVNKVNSTNYCICEWDKNGINDILYLIEGSVHSKQDWGNFVLSVTGNNVYINCPNGLFRTTPYQLYAIK